MRSLPIIGITMGDAAGVGPEIIIKSLSDPKTYNNMSPIVIGDTKVLKRTNLLLKTNLNINSVDSVDDALFEYGTIDCFNLDILPSKFPVGEVSSESGNASFYFLEKAISLANSKKIDAICTAPLNKEALHKGGHEYPGHTEILAKLTNTDTYAMLLSTPNLKVIHVTTHIGIIDAIKKITSDRVYKTINLANNTLKQFGFQNPRIAVCGINPHAGEGGLFGYREEEEKIVPAVNKAKKEQINVIGPLPADTLFFRAVRGDFDVVVAMYHDQGHGPVKALGLELGVNITAGLPIIRTSVDHGTAFDIAGEGVADEASMKEALRQAAKLASST